MNEIDESSKLSKPILSIHPLVIVIFFGGIFLLAVGMGMAFYKSQGSGQIKIISQEDQVQGEKTQEVLVHVDGSVVRPGVYMLTAESRVNDAIVAAGGLTASSSTSTLNLAAKVVDGQKIFVPDISQQTNQSTTADSPVVEGVLISINYASAAQLDKLSGIGEVTAKKIIDNRPYATLEELLTKKAVTKSVYDKIKSQISL